MDGSANPFDLKIQAAATGAAVNVSFYTSPFITDPVIITELSVGESRYCSITVLVFLVTLSVGYPGTILSFSPNVVDTCARIRHSVSL